MIIDQLARDSDSLKHCSLVSRQWVPRCRYHLLRVVSFLDMHPGRSLERWRTTFGASDGTRFPRFVLDLRQLLTESASGHGRFDPRNPFPPGNTHMGPTGESLTLHATTIPLHQRYNPQLWQPFYGGFHRDVRIKLLQAVYRWRAEPSIIPPHHPPDVFNEIHPPLLSSSPYPNLGATVERGR